MGMPDAAAWYSPMPVRAWSPCPWVITARGTGRQGSMWKPPAGQYSPSGRSTTRSEGEAEVEGDMPAVSWAAGVAGVMGRPVRHRGAVVRVLPRHATARRPRPRGDTGSRFRYRCDAGP